MASECRTLQLLQTAERPLLLVSLPANDVNLARAARDGGAEGLKVHINIHHAAAGVRFGSLNEEAPRLRAIVELGLPVGIVPGDTDNMASEEDVQRLREMGLDFADAYLEAMPAWMLDEKHMGIMAAVGPADMRRPNRVRATCRIPGVSMVEASIIAHDGYGHELRAADIADYLWLAETMQECAVPIIVPSQRRIAPRDVPVLAGTGIRGLLIGAVVTGQTPESILSATRLYRTALDELEPRESGGARL